MNGVDDVFDANLGFDEIFVGAEAFAAFALVFAREGGHHDDANFGGFGGGAQNV